LPPRPPSGRGWTTRPAGIAASRPRSSRISPSPRPERSGIVSLTPSAGTRQEQQLIEPRGLDQLTITTDLPDPHPS
jgi:hypothetical protein